MLEASHRVDLPTEPFARAFEEQQLRPHDLERHLAPQRHLFGRVDEAHAPRPQLRAKTEVAELPRHTFRLRLQQRRRREVRQGFAQPGRLVRMRRKELLHGRFPLAIEQIESLSEQVLEGGHGRRTIGAGRILVA